MVHLHRSARPRASLTRREDNLKMTGGLWTPAKGKFNRHEPQFLKRDRLSALDSELRATFQEGHMRYRMGNAPELTRLLLSVFTEVPQPAVAKGLHRYLWSHARFGYAEQLADALDDVRSVQSATFCITK